MPFDILSVVAGAVKTVGAKAAGAALHRWNTHRKLHQQLESIKFQLKMNRDVRSYVSLLRQIREIFIAHPDLMQDGDNCAFFSKWLRDPVVELGWSAGGEYWSRERIADLHRDIRDLHA